MPYSNIKHLFFDLDDTLWDFESNSKLVIVDLFKKYNLNSLLNTTFESFFITYKKINAQLWQQYSLKLITKQYLRDYRFELSFNAFNYSNINLSIAFSEDYISQSPYGKKLIPKAIQVLDYLKPKYNLHIITNGFKEVQYIKLNNCNLLPYFDQIIISEEHDTNKPDKKIFEIAQQLAKANLNECLMIGDNFDNDIAGAKNAGWQAVWFNNNVNNNPNSINDLKDLTKYL
ncbi:MAG: YjjG family noncanonical pyrimidine nucleotidase [Bacteroidetes bacterium]|nr:YjjG family noncanonical pyrimidine nucleotidase [Bacteroidota bacterium]